MVFTLVDYADFSSRQSLRPNQLALGEKTRASGAGKEIDTTLEILLGGYHASQRYLETTAWVKGERKQWSPMVKTILAFILTVLALSPAILGIHWQHLLP